MAQVLGCDLYFSLHPVSDENPRSIYTKTHKANVMVVNALYSEFDDVDFGGDATGFTAQLDPRPSVTIHSGGGVHAYWLLDVPFRLSTPEDRQRAEELQRRWQRLQGGDKGVNNLDRVLRIPGTLNHKYSPARPVVIKSWEPERQYTFTALEGLLPLEPAKPAPVAGAGAVTTASDDELLALARKSHNGMKFSRLWDGNLADYGDDHSAADLGLCQMLAFWTGRDAQRMDRLFRNSALYRPQKWARKDYREGTLSKACAQVSAVYQPSSATGAAVAAAQTVIGHRAAAPGRQNGAGASQNGSAPIHTATAASAQPPPSATPSQAPTPTGKPVRMSDLEQDIVKMLGRRMSRDDKADLSRLVVDFLVANNRLFWDTVTGRTYVQDDDYQVLDLVGGAEASARLRRFLRDAGLNSTEFTYAYVIEEMTMAAVRNPIRLHQNMVQLGNALYIPCGASWYVRATTTAGLEKMPNGTDGVYFVARSAIPEWEPLPLPQTKHPLDLRALHVAIDAPPDVSTYTADMQRLLLSSWLVAFMAGIRPLPILATLGSKGGGKSMLLRSIMKLLLGADQDMTTLTADKRDFDTMTTNDLLVGLDNVDQLQQGTEWLYDSLATVATGGMNKRRQYHTLADQVNLQIVAAVMLSSRTASFARPDVAERTLPIFVRPFEDAERVPDSLLLAELPRERDAVVSWLAYHAADVLERVGSAPAGLPARFQDFARVVWGHCVAIGEEPQAVALLTAWRKAQSMSVGDADPLMNAIAEYLANDPTGLGLFDLSAKALLDKLKAEGYEVPFLGGGKRIAARLRELKSTFAGLGIQLTERVSQSRPFFTIRFLP